MQRTRILVVEDYPLLQELYRELLARDAGLEIVGEFSSGGAALENLERLQPDVVLVDLGLPDMSGLEATRRLKAAAPQVEVIVLLDQGLDEYAEAALASGAAACLLKERAAVELLPALRRMQAGAPADQPMAAWDG